MSISTQTLHGTAIYIHILYAYIDPLANPNVGIYGIHGVFGVCWLILFVCWELAQVNVCGPPRRVFFG